MEAELALEPKKKISPVSPKRRRKICKKRQWQTIFLISKEMTLQKSG